MKISAETKAKNRKAILEAAARQVRESGPSGVSVANAMSAAGLTHGGFYNHFASRDELVAEALDHAACSAVTLLRNVAEKGGLERFLKVYLSEDHLEGVAQGCPFAATATEIAHQPESVRSSFVSGLREFLDTGSENLERSDALNRLSGAMGALILARAVAQDDHDLALELLSAARPK